MLNQSNIGDQISAIEKSDSLLFISQSTLSGLNSRFRVFGNSGVLQQPDIPTSANDYVYSLFLDDNDGIYTLDANDLISKYNPDTGELDVLAGQTSAWVNPIIARFANGRFLTSGSDGIGIQYFQLCDIDGTCDSKIFPVLNNLPSNMQLPINSISGDSNNTIISGFTSGYGVFRGTATYNNDGIMTEFTSVNNIIDEYYGGTIYGNEYYIQNGTLRIMEVRDLSTDNVLRTIPMEGNPYPRAIFGSVGLSSLDFVTISGMLKEVRTISRITKTIPNADGDPILFVFPGRKEIEMSVTSNNEKAKLDRFLNGSFAIFVIDDEIFEIKTINAVDDNHGDREYLVVWHTPEKF
jgi:hypothetical protein